MGVWSFKEKSGQGGHVLEPTSKSWPLAQKVEGRKKFFFKRNGNCPKGTSVDPWPTGDRWSSAGGRRPLVAGMPETSGRGLVARSLVATIPAAQGRPATSGRPPTAGRHLRLWDNSHFFEIFLFKKKNFWKFGWWARAFGRMGVQHPHFLKLAPTLGSANSSEIHGEWRFHFFPQFVFAKFSPYLDLHIYRWDFCFRKF
jgi:hypothetical protein